jgi:hypothetical protein
VIITINKTLSKSLPEKQFVKKKKKIMIKEKSME